MNRNNFNENVTSILDKGSIENISILNVEKLKDIIMDEKLNKLLFDGFKTNYENVYADNEDCIVIKIQDLLYRLHLLINKILIEENNINNKDEIYDAVFNYVINNSILYDAVNYNDSDLEELKNDTINQSEVLNIQ